jgi:hypothetical protein
VGPFDIPNDLNRTQEIGGLLITFDEFGLSVGDRVFGYEISVPASGSRPGLDLLPSAAAFLKDSLPGDAVSLVSVTPEPQNTLLLLSFAMGLTLLLRRQRLPVKP